MEYKNDIKEKLAALGQLYLTIKQYTASLNETNDTANNAYNTNEENSSDGENGEKKGPQDQLKMLQGAISDLDFKISTLLKQYVTVVLPIWFDAFL
jgi:hypothetical protein